MNSLDSESRPGTATWPALHRGRPEGARPRSSARQRSPMVPLSNWRRTTRLLAEAELTEAAYQKPTHSSSAVASSTGEVSQVLVWRLPVSK